MPSIERDNLAGMIPEPVTREIFQGVVEQSAVLRVGRKLPNMTSKTQTINVLDMLPIRGPGLGEEKAARRGAGGHHPDPRGRAGGHEL